MKTQNTENEKHTPAPAQILEYAIAKLKPSDTRGLVQRLGFLNPDDTSGCRLSLHMLLSVKTSAATFYLKAADQAGDDAWLAIEQARAEFYSHTPGPFNVDEAVRWIMVKARGQQ